MRLLKGEQGFFFSEPSVGRAGFWVPGFFYSGESTAVIGSLIDVWVPKDEMKCTASRAWRRQGATPAPPVHCHRRKAAERAGVI